MEIEFVVAALISWTHVPGGRGRHTDTLYLNRTAKKHYLNTPTRTEQKRECKIFEIGKAFNIRIKNMTSSTK